ncbi:YdcF family protein [Eleftheria terrae]|uniref:YdcF family protein n=1 Tax=Eleftheria terrae TaxID=1597781 RepID=UPI00263BC718|nr:YdcF family protein [Eleftheria terrae]WKB52367.1 YdcF family protein [Eleftheria terrae]
MPRLATPGRRWLWRLLVAAASAYALAAAAIVVRGLDDEVFPADLIVVPGNTVAPDGHPGPRLKARLDAALLLYRQGRAPRLLVSGGIGREGHDEAAAMARYLVAQGVPAAAIVQDNQGVNTAATARFTARYLQRHGLTSALVASQYFHVARTRLALQKAGVPRIGSAHARYVEWRDAYSLAREVPAYLMYWWMP